jgi:hypothetical protein
VHLCCTSHAAGVEGPRGRLAKLAARWVLDFITVPSYKICAFLVISHTKVIYVANAIYSMLYLLEKQ